MTLLEAGLVLLAGLGAGTINAIVGSGTLITFPVLVAFGVPPVTATMSNAVGLVPGNIASSFGYREELRGQWRRILQLLPASLVGALIGAFLLLTLPEDAFETIVPVLLVAALIMVVGQPALQRYLRSRAVGRGGAARAGGSEQTDPEAPAGTESTTGSEAPAGSVEPKGAGEAAGPAGPVPLSTGRYIAVLAAVFFTAIYGGYFAAAQGIILVGLLGLLLPDSLQRINGAKNVLVLIVNSVAATIYIIIGFDRISWLSVLLIAVGSLIGGYVGARIGRRLNPVVLRTIIVILGLVALWNLLQI